MVQKQPRLPQKKGAKRLKVTETMCYHCFDALIDELLGTTTKPKSSCGSWRSIYIYKAAPTDTPAYVRDLPDPAMECPIFVTWEKVRPNAGNNNNNNNGDDATVYELRGCIGTLSPKPLLTSIGEYALNSALKDRRFSPITAEEIPSLRVAVSLLVEYEPCRDCFDWVVGTHGILIRFWSAEAHRDFSATYLPEVAQEQGWDQRVTVTSLIRKSGYPGEIEQELFDAIQCTRYQSSKLHMTYQEFMEIRQRPAGKLQNGNNKVGAGTPPSTGPSSASSSFQHPEVDDNNRYCAPPPDKWSPCNNL